MSNRGTLQHWLDTAWQALSRSALDDLHSGDEWREISARVRLDALAVIDRHFTRLMEDGHVHMHHEQWVQVRRLFEWFDVTKVEVSA